MVVDSSAVIAIVVGEAMAPDCADALAADDRLMMSTVTITEILIVASKKGKLDSAERLLAGLDLNLFPVTEARARAAGEVYRQWGKGFHKAKLNFGDSFVYALAKELDCPLLFVGRDFSQTDVEPALA